jgi:uncharacterized protein YhaN
MRIDELQLLAVGPFTGKSLDFSRGNHGLHVVFGPNEAGKSSALRALRALLFGFDDRTPDGFLHGYPKLAVGGRLRAADGKHIALVRHKKRKGSIIDLETEAALPDDALDPFLGGLTEQSFCTLFGIDHDRLVSGGQEMLQQQGDLGQALFTAASGVGRLRGVLDTLASQAEELFSPRGRSHAIARTTAALHEAEKAARHASLAVRDWEGANQRLEDARIALARLSVERAELAKEKVRAERWLRLIPRLAQRRALLAEAAAQPEAPELSQDFSNLWQSAIGTLESAQEQLSGANQRREQLHQTLEEVALDPTLLAATERIDQASRELGAYEKAQKDRNRIDATVRASRNAAREVLRGLRQDRSLEDLPALRPGIESIRRSLEDLVTSHSGLVQAQRKAQQNHQELSTELAQLQEPPEEPIPEADTGPLERAVQAARRDGDLARQSTAEARKLATLERSCTDELSALGRWAGPLDGIDALPLPGEETIVGHATQLAELEEAQRARAQRRDDIRAQLADAERELRILTMESSVPSEEDLTQVRTLRNKGWNLVRRAWLEDADVDAESAALFSGKKTLDRAFEESVLDGDSIADRLRREAERVASRAQHEARRASLSESTKAIEQEMETLARERAIAETRWRELWTSTGITPGTPAEMRAWLPRLSALRDRYHDLGEARERLHQTQEAMAHHAQALLTQLSELGRQLDPQSDLPALLSEADQLLARRAERKARQETRKRLMRDSARAKDELARATKDLEVWQTEWADVMKPLGLPADTRPKSAKSTLEGYLEVFKHLDEADSHERRIIGIQKEEVMFRTALDKLAQKTSPGPTDEAPKQRVERLKRELDLASQARVRREGLSTELAALEVKIAGLESRRVAAEARIAELLNEAGCTERDQVPEAEQRAREKRSRRERLQQLEETLLEDGAGADLPALEAELCQVDADQLKTRLAELPGLLERADAEVQRTAAERGAAEGELARMSGADAAAEASASAEALLAQLSGEVDRYLPLRLAELLLRREIERFLEENQSPLLEQAGHHFADLTGQAFRGIRAEVDDRDHPILISLRGDGSRLQVEGLSTGTRDQLFLALRLAAVEAHVARAEPIPFVVDDVLVQFDDDRALAALRVFAGLAKSTQVLLFTHHKRILEMATVLAGEFEVYALDLT